MTYQYDANSKGRMVTKILDMQGHFTEYTNNYKLGVVTQTRDHNNLITTFGYDTFGRLSQTKSPDNNTSVISYAWVTGGTPANALFTKTTAVPGVPSAVIYMDKLGRTVFQETTGLDGRKLYAQTAYNSKGQVDYITFPYYAGDPNTDRKSFTYYADGRLKTEIAPGTNLSYSYSGLIATITDNIKVQTFTREANADGSMKKATDAGGDVTYSYFANGLPKQVIAAGSTFAMTYDQFGRQLSLTDPNAGTTSYTYNVYGELESQTDAKATTISMGYNNLGQPTYVNQPTFNNTYTYKTNGLPQSVSSSNSTSITYGYDAYQRPNATSVNIQGTTLGSSITYDSFGRISTVTYPSGFGITYVYANGYLKEIKRNDNGGSVWRLDKVNSKGQITQSTMGERWVTYKTYDPVFGYITSIKSGSNTYQNLEYRYNSKGYMDMRKDYRHNSISETFDYDNLGRLYKINGVQTVSYAANGNINTKADAGTFTYPTRPHAVAGITGNGGTISNTQQDISYTSFNKINTIVEGSRSATFTYGPDYNRGKVVTVANGVTTTRYYSGNYEREIKNGVTRELNYITANGQIVAIFEMTSTGNRFMHYVFTDHLGSVNVIVNDGGAIEQELSFDAWGNRRDPATWVNLTTAPANLITNRGFTGHEHMDDFKLINMNGRVYDPVLGRFLSPDPFISNPLSTQDYNRYSYCVNNPLMFTDPSGYMIKVYIGRSSNELQQEYMAMLNFGSGGGGGDYFAMAIPHLHGELSSQYNYNYTTDQYINGLGETVSSDEAISCAIRKAGPGDGTTYLIYQTGYLNRAGAWVGNGHYGFVRQGVVVSTGLYPTFSNMGAAINYVFSGGHISSFDLVNGDASGQGDEYYNNQYGNPSASLDEFASYYKGKTENQIVFGQSSFLGYKFPNDINKQFRFVKIGNGREVDMIHFMVVGRRGSLLGYANEIKQALSFSSSAFYPQDLYSNKLGINFFNRYGTSIQQNPTKISEYIDWYLSNPDNW